MSPLLPLRELLRQATAAAHARVDAQVGPLDSHAAYVDYLKGMRGFLAAAAAMLDPEPALPPLLRALDRDLESAGVHGGPTGPRGPGPVVGEDEAGRLGWRYVTAGASVGARMLRRQVMLLQPLPRCEFLGGYSNSGLWPECLQRLSEASLDAEARERCVAAARLAFQAAEHSFSRALEAPPR